MLRATRIPILFLALAIGCGDPAPPGTDAAGIDAGVDAAGIDAGGIDAATPDASADGGRDAGAPDPCAEGACGPCDTGLAIDSSDAADAVRALGLCAGVLDAAWILPDGSAPSADTYAIGHGILGGLGSAGGPFDGSALLALSTGTARAPSDPGFQPFSGYDKMYESAFAPGFPVESPACPGIVTGQVHDAVALRFSVDVPEGANGFRLLSKHHSYEWPSFVCSTYDDQLAILVDPAPAEITHGVALDPEGNVISVNTSFLEVCECAGGPPCFGGGREFACSSGGAELAGTGYDAPDAGAATPWLETRVPVTAGTRITITLALWDSGDGLLDSTTLFDGFRWITDAPAAPETRIAP